MSITSKTPDAPSSLQFATKLVLSAAAASVAETGRVILILYLDYVVRC